MDLCSQLDANAGNNGELSAAPRVMELRGWTSSGSRQAALKELLDARLLAVTSPGDRKRCTLYALTPWPLDYNPSRMQYGPGLYAVQDWTEGMAGATDQLTPLSLAADRAPAPAAARWNVARRGERRRPDENATGLPAAGEPPTDISPQRANPPGPEDRYEPAAGSYLGKATAKVSPLRATSLEKPSAGTPGTLPAPASKPRAKAGQAAMERARPLARAFASAEESVRAEQVAPPWEPSS